MAKKSAFEEARDFLKGATISVGNKLSAFGQDYMNYGRKLQQQKIDRAQRIQSFIKDNPYVDFTRPSLLGPIGQIKPSRQAMENIPAFNFADKAVERQNTGLKKFGVGLALGIPQSILNTPRMLTGGIIRTENAVRDRKPLTQVIGTATEPAEGLLNLLTMGAGGGLASQGGRQLLIRGSEGVGKQSLKQLFVKGIGTGAKYGFGYGTLQGLQANQNANNVGEQLLGTLPYSATGAVTGGAIGGPVAVTSYVLNNAITKYLTPAIRNMFLENKKIGGFLTPEEMRQSAKMVGNSRPGFVQWANQIADAAEQQGLVIKLDLQGTSPNKMGQLMRVRGGETYSAVLVQPPTSNISPAAIQSVPQTQLMSPEARPQLNAPTVPIIPPSEARTFVTNATSPEAPTVAPTLEEVVAPAEKIIQLGQTSLKNILPNMSPNVQTIANQLVPAGENIQTSDGIKLLFGQKLAIPEDIAVRLSKEITSLENEAGKYASAGVAIPAELSSDIKQLTKQLAGVEEVPGIKQLTVAEAEKKFSVGKAPSPVETSPFSDIITTGEIPGVKKPEVPFDQAETFQTTLRMLDEFRRVNSEIPDIFTPKAVDASKILSDEQVAQTALDNFRGYAPNKEPAIKYTPEVEARFQELSTMKADFQKQIGEIEDALRNYEFYGKRFGELLNKTELKSLKTDLVKSVKSIDQEAKGLQETGEPIMVLAPAEPVPGNDELAIEALRNWRDGVPPIEKSPAEALLSTAREPDYYKNLTPEQKAKGIEEAGNAAERMTGGKDEVEGSPLEEGPQIATAKALEEVNKSLGRPVEFNKAQKELFNSIFAKWIGQRDVAKTEGVELAEKFAGIPAELGPEIIRARENPDIPMSEEVAQWIKPIAEEYDRLYQTAVDAGINIHYLNNYMTHIWEKSPEEVATAYLAAKTRFNFAGERLIPTYDEGIQMGLTPRFTHPAQIIAHYVERLEQTKANVKMMLDLKAAGIVVSAAEGIKYPGYAAISAPGVDRSIGRTTVGKKTGLVVGDYYAPREVANVLNKVFSPDERNWFGKTVGVGAKLSGLVQDVTLSGGLPYTPLNAYTFGQAVKEFTAGVGGMWNSPVLSTKRILSPIVSVLRSTIPGQSTQFFKDNVGVIKEMQALNIPVSTNYSIENIIDKKLAERVFGKGVREIWNKAINEPTFKKFMPMLQINMYKDIKNAALKKNMSPEVASEVAAKAVKSFYGVVGSEEIAKRSRVFHDAISTVLFAPKYRESMVRIWWTAAKSASPIGVEGGKVKGNNPFNLSNLTSTNFLIGTLLTIAAYNIAQIAITGKPMSENPEGMEDKLLIPIAGGTVMGIPILPSVGTVPRAAIRTLNDILRGDIPAALGESKAYLSSLLAPLVEAGTNENYFGQQIYEDNDSPAQKYKKMGLYLATAYNHPWIEAVISHYVNNEPTYQTISKAMELPIRWYTTKSINAKYYYANLDQARTSLSPDAQVVWDKLHPSSGPVYTDEDGLAVDDARSTMANALDRIAHPEIVVAEGDVELQTAQDQGNPVNPFYNLTAGQQLTVLMLKTFYPGEATKKQIQNENLEWLQPYWDARDTWYKDMESRGLMKKDSPGDVSQNKKDTVYALVDKGVTSTKEITSILNDASVRQGSDMTFTEDEVNKAIVDRGYITPSPEVQQKLDYYNTLPKGTGARSRYLRANPDVTAYFDAQTQLTNDKRLELGLPPTSSSGGSSGWGSYKAKPKIKVPAASKSKKVSLKGPLKTTITPLKTTKTSLRSSVKAIPKRTYSIGSPSGKVSLKVKNNLPAVLSGIK